MRAKRNRRTRSNKNDYHLNFETLESRKLLASVSLSNGILNVIGDSTNDMIYVASLYGTGENAVSVAVNFQVWNFEQVSETRVFAGDGNDTITAVNGIYAKLYGEDGNDTITGSSGYQLIDGGNGNDNLDGGSGDDHVVGRNGTDVLIGGTGDDLLNGGADNDFIYGNDGDDVMYGLGGDDVMLGGEGDDRIIGHDGNDDLWGEAGEDFIDGSSGDDAMNGGANNDTLYGRNGNDEIDCNYGDDLANGGSGDDILIGNFGNDTLYGMDGFDRIWGSVGDDILNGGEGDDDLFGGSGNDTVIGANGNDQLFGDDGDDLIFGQNGNDSVAGGNGNDVIRGEAGSDRFLEHNTVSTNRDFVAGDDVTVLFDDGSEVTSNGAIYAGANWTGQEIFFVDQSLAEMHAVSRDLIIDHLELDGEELHFVRQGDWIGGNTAGQQTASWNDQSKRDIYLTQSLFDAGYVFVRQLTYHEVGHNFDGFDASGAITSAENPSHPNFYVISNWGFDTNTGLWDYFGDQNFARSYGTVHPTEDFATSFSARFMDISNLAYQGNPLPGQTLGAGNVPLKMQYMDDFFATLS